MAKALLLVSALLLCAVAPRALAAPPPPPPPASFNGGRVVSGSVYLTDNAVQFDIPPQAFRPDDFRAAVAQFFKLSPAQVVINSVFPSGPAAVTVDWYTLFTNAADAAPFNKTIQDAAQLKQVFATAPVLPNPRIAPAGIAAPTAGVAAPTAGVAGGIGTNTATGGAGGVAAGGSGGSASGNKVTQGMPGASSPGAPGSVSYGPGGGSGGIAQGGAGGASVGGAGGSASSGSRRH